MWEKHAVIVQQLSEEIESIVSSMRNSALSELSERLRPMQDRVDTLVADDKLRLEFHRGIASHLFSESISRKCTPEVCGEQFEALVALGFNHISEKYTRTVILAKLYVHFERKKEALKLLSDIRQELHSSKTRDRFVEDDLEHSEWLIRAIEEDSLPPF